MQFQRHCLDNGLEIIAECNPHAYSAAIGFFVNAGSRDETDEISGVSHFLEHMVFKGTPHRTAEDVNRELDEMGSSSNARTSEEQTIYHATVLPEFQDRMVGLLADILRPSLRDDDFEMEKQVIIEEIWMYDDQPPYGGHEKIMADFFGSHPLSRSVLGTVESVGGLQPEQMRAYFERQYSPSNITLVGTGQIDFDAFVAQAEKCCGAWESKTTQREITPAQTHPGFELMIRESSAQEYVLQLAKAPSCEDPLRFAAQVLCTIFGDDSGSRLYWEFVDPGIAEYAGMGSYEYQGCGVALTVLCSDPEAVEHNLKKLQQLQAALQSNGVTERELDLAKRKIAAQIIRHSERPENRLFAIGSNWLQRREYQTVREIAEDYRNVTLDDVHQVLAQFPLTECRTLAVGPVKSLNVSG